MVGFAGRRATAAAGRGRRKASFVDIFTACYSSIFASAAIVDAISKDERRREWTQQLEEAKLEFAAIKAQGQPPRTDYNDGRVTTELDDLQMDTIWRVMKRIYIERPYHKDIFLPASLSTCRYIGHLRHSYYGCPSRKVLRKGQAIDYRALEKAMLRESETQPAVGALTETQIAHETVRIQSLVSELLSIADRESLGTAYAEKHTPVTFLQVWKMIHHCHTSYRFRASDPEEAHLATLSLNKVLRQVLESRLPPREKFGRICYNLLTSPFAPDIHTYNLLIAGFDKHGHHEQSEAMIYSFLYGRYIRPTVTTHIAIMNHYKVMGRSGRFLVCLARITGIEETVGGKIRRRHLDGMYRYGEQRWLWENPLSKSVSGDYVMEHVPINGALVEELMRGLLHFRLYDQAALLLEGCLKCGVVLGSKVVRQLLDECVANLDWSGGVRVLQGMIEFGREWVAMVKMGGEEARHMLRRLYTLLDMCGIRMNGSDKELMPVARRLRVSLENIIHVVKLVQAMKYEVLGYYKTRNVKFSYQPVKSRLLQLESINKEYIKVRKTTTSIESKLLRSELPFEFRWACCGHICEAALERSEQLSEEFSELMSRYLSIPMMGASEREEMASL